MMPMIDNNVSSLGKDAKTMAMSWRNSECGAWRFGLGFAVLGLLQLGVWVLGGFGKVRSIGLQRIFSFATGQSGHRIFFLFFAVDQSFVEPPTDLPNQILTRGSVLDQW